MLSLAHVGGVARCVAVGRGTIAARCRGYAKKAAQAIDSDWEVVVGLEIHAQILAKSKLFSDSPLKFAALANSCVSFHDAALPGTLPVPNARCVDAAITTGVALGGTVNRTSFFDRKHYFYCDLPAGYQITQHRVPIVSGGEVNVEFVTNPADSAAPVLSERVRIQRLQLEQDSGKSIHDAHPKWSLIDLNRAGSALMEIVTAPDMRSSESAAAFVRKLQLVLRTLGTCDGNIAEGSLRVDANVSVRNKKTYAPTDLGVRVEIKNVAGVRHLQRAIEYEYGRQVRELEAGRRIARETRMFDAAAGETRPMRTKEDDTDYRYMPEPDLPPLVVESARVDALVASMPELPDAAKLRFVSDYGIPSLDAIKLTTHEGAAAYFEEAVAACIACSNSAGSHSDRLTAGPRVSSWLVQDIFGHLNRANLEIAFSPLSPQHLGEIASLLLRDVISTKSAKSLLAMKMGGESRSPVELVEALNLSLVSDPEVLRRECEAVVASMPKEVAQSRGGKTNVYNALVGMALKRTGGRAKPDVLDRVMRELVFGSAPDGKQ